jgi:hypothetical protein
MIKIFYIVLLSLLVIFSTYRNEAYARTKQRTPTHTTWEAEPDSFLGIKFGQPLDSQMPECPKHTYSTGFSSYETNYSIDAKACWEELGRGFRTISNPPALGVFYQATAYVINGLFEGIVITFDHYNYLKMLDLFRERYGSPSHVQKSSFQTHSGMKLEGNVYHWVGRNVEIRFSEYGSKLDEGEVDISTKALQNSYIEENKRNSDRYKDRL